ncbi:MAG: DUF6612 family protein [Lachnospiraceae bacterium]|jgi:hypothetical protein|nr:DUF6612 family protein [Lachnospiraceae bacterium]
MKRRGYAVTAAIMLCSTVLAGCRGKVTAQSLLLGAASKTASESSYDANLALDLEASGTVSGVSVDMGFYVDMDMEATQEPIALHAQGSMSIDILGQNQETGMEMYVEEGDGKLYSYTSAGDGKWTRNVEENYMDLSTLYSEEQVKMLADSLELKEDTTEINDIECYEVSGKLQGDGLEGILKGAMGSLGNSDLLGEIDLEGAEVPVAYFIGKESGYPVKISIDMQDVMGRSLQTGDDSGADLECRSFKMEMTMNSFGTVDAIRVPKEVKQAAESQ